MDGRMDSLVHQDDYYCCCFYSVYGCIDTLNIHYIAIYSYEHRRVSVSLIIRSLLLLFTLLLLLCGICY